MAQPKAELVNARRTLNRISRRAQQWLTVRSFRSTAELIAAAKAEGMNLWVSHLHSANEAIADSRSSSEQQQAIRESQQVSLPIHDRGLREELLGTPAGRKIGVVVGNEHTGVTEEMVSAASRLVHVPMFGFLESMNVGVAAAMLLQTTANVLREEKDVNDRKRLSNAGISDDSNSKRLLPEEGGLTDAEAEVAWGAWNVAIREPWLFKRRKHNHKRSPRSS